jgi:ATP-dependent HslUV protease ATP-binding subunit HslU
MEREQEARAAGANLAPRELVAALDQHIVGQSDAKRAVAIALRNRWRRQQLDPQVAQDVMPRNILMIGSTGVGKTEIARRLARLTGAPFLKVEATRYTEVGYYGRDVESMVRELVDQAVQMVRQQAREKVQAEAEKRARDRLLDLLCPPVQGNFRARIDDPPTPPPGSTWETTRNRIGELLDAGEMEERMVDVTIEQQATPVMLGGVGVQGMDMDFQGMLEKLVPKNRVTRKVTVKAARKILHDQESDNLLDDEQINHQAIELAANLGIIFIDEIDKVIASESKGADVSRQGVQRDLLPIVEGTSVQTRHGYIRTDHVLFIAAGAFHGHQPSELMPELQGRFPIRVELQDLVAEDFYRILSEPRNSIVRQVQALMQTEGIALEFTDGALRRIATLAFEVNQSTQNIGARRLSTLIERVVEELSFDAAELPDGSFLIDEALVERKLAQLVADEDLSRFVL